MIEATGSVSPAALDYLQRTGIDPWADVATAPRTVAPPGSRRLLHVAGVSVPPRPVTGSAVTPESVSTENLLVGLSGYQIPVAYTLHGRPSGVSVHVATWSPTRESAPPAALDARREVLATVLRGLAAGVDATPVDPTTESLPFGGLVVGVPTKDALDLSDGANAIDRLARALTGREWATLVLAEPVSETSLAKMRARVINEMRTVAAAEQATGAPSPLGQHYSSLLEVVLANLTQGLAVGAWRTAVYLLGDAVSYPALAAVWKAIFSGAQSLPEPIRVFDSEVAIELAGAWAMADQIGAEGPAGFRHPYAAQTLLTSFQLSAYVQLPRSSSYRAFAFGSWRRSTPPPAGATAACYLARADPARLPRP